MADPCTPKDDLETKLRESIAQAEWRKRVEERRAKRESAVTNGMVESIGKVLLAGTGWAEMLRLAELGFPLDSAVRAQLEEARQDIELAQVRIAHALKKEFPK